MTSRIIYLEYIYFFVFPSHLVFCIFCIFFEIHIICIFCIFIYIYIYTRTRVGLLYSYTCKSLILVHIFVRTVALDGQIGFANPTSRGGSARRDAFVCNKKLDWSNKNHKTRNSKHKTNSWIMKQQESIYENYTKYKHYKI